MDSSVPHNILIIDDDPDLRETIALALQAEGYKTWTASSGRQGLQVIEDWKSSDQPIACIILDLMMPEMDGQQFLSVLYERHPAMRKVPVLVATAMGNHVKLRAFPSSVQRIQKPMELEELYAAVRESCRTSPPTA